jgi:hypothetical protein
MHTLQFMLNCAASLGSIQKNPASFEHIDRTKKKKKKKKKKKFKEGTFVWKNLQESKHCYYVEYMLIWFFSVRFVSSIYIHTMFAYHFLSFS